MPVIHRSALALCLSLSLLPALSQAQTETASCAKSDPAQISALFDRWNRSLATLDPEQVVANYAQDAVLLPTVSNKPRTNHAEIRDYFVHFLEKKPQGRIDRRVLKIGCNVAQDVGLYTFRFKDGSEVSARYSYVYEYRDGQWLTAHHHSSAMPEKR